MGEVGGAMTSRAATARDRSRSTTRRHPTRRVLVALALLILIGAIGGTRVVFSRVPVDSMVDQRYSEAISRDPAHATFYSHIYAAYQRLTGSDALHYVVHRVAERAAAATGHTAAAQTQAVRASEHDPPQADWVNALRQLWERVKRAAASPGAHAVGDGRRMPAPATMPVD
jgi:hypothetical protein